MSKHIEAAVRYSGRPLLKLWAFVISLALGLLGFAGCCRDQAAEYGVFPLYGMPVPKYGIIPTELVEKQKAVDPGSMESENVDLTVTQE